MMRNKVFCIGFHKTGTSSLGAALEVLGYRVTGPNGIADPNIASNVYVRAYDLVSQYDAFKDNPWPIIFKDIDARYPNSKFILTLRDPESWIRSQVRHFGREDNPMRKWIYGVGHPEGNEGVYLDRYKKHNAEVIDYFEGRPNDLLVMDLSKGFEWKDLCSFLEMAVLDIPFPHENKASDREKGKSLSVWIKRKSRSVARRLK